MRSSPMLVTIFMLASEALADDGMWHPQQYAGSGSSNANAVNPQAAGAAAGAGAAYTPSVPAYAVATAKTLAAVTPAAGLATPAAQGSWEQAVTWPAGCEKWANPCPAGAKISGGAVAGAVATQTPEVAAVASPKTLVSTATPSAPYENGFTSYTSMTDAFGVITGMPTVVTVPAGVSSTTAAASTTLQTSTRVGNSTSLPTRTATRTQAGFSTGTNMPSFNAAGRMNVGAELPLVVAFVGVLALIA